MSKKKKTSKSNQLLISINKCAYILNMSEPTLIDWLKEKKIVIQLDTSSQQCISYDNFKSLANDEKKYEKANPDLLNYLKDRANWDIEKMRNDVSKMLKKYREYVELITEYHAEIFKTHFMINNESPMNAALLLYAKIINMSNMFLDSIEKSYNSSILIIRTIDEANTLAQYFSMLKEDERCNKDLIAWFRYEKSPSAAECREKLAKLYAPQAGIPEKLLEQLHDDVYEVKSKAIHHSYRDCSELLEFELKDNKTIIENISYKESSVYRQIEVVDYFESIINNVLQGFLLCFKDVLSDENKSKLVVLTTGISFK